MDLDAIKGVGPATKEKFHEAGVTDVEALAKADVATLAEETGISADRVEAFAEQARALAGVKVAAGDVQAASEAPAAREPVPEATAAPAEAADGAAPKTWKVVLRDRAATARVDAGEVTYENLPIVTAKATEDHEEIMKEIGYNSVLLKEGEHTAFVRANGTWEHAVPIYKEKTLEGSDVTELVRVRVHEIRERGGGSKAGAAGQLTTSGGSAKKSGGLFGLFKKKA